jgi:enoyl-CoA hydratase
MAKLVEVERIGRVVLARLNNPPHALMTSDMVAEIGQLVREADADDGIGVVVFTGAHPDRFLAHFDVGELLTSAQQAPAVSKRQAAVIIRIARALAKVPGVRYLLEHSPAAGIIQLEQFHDVLLQMGRSGTIYIAAINGQTAGGGLELALACDLRYLTSDGELAQPEVLLGFPPGGGGTQRMARLIGRAAALEIMLTGRAIPADEAKKIGLVTGLFPDAQFLGSVMEVAQHLATRPKPAVAVIKQAVLEGGSLDLPSGLAIEKAGLLAMFGEPGTQAAMTAYVRYEEETGKLAATDPQARELLTNGEFSPFNPV